MKAFFLSIILMAAITAAAAAVLGTVDMSAQGVYTSKNGNVRL